MQQENVQNDGFKYILTVIDLFSRYAWAEALRTKSPLHVRPAFESIFAKGRKPMKLQTDQGTEFEAKSMQDFFKAHNIHHFSVKSQFKAAVVERFNRTLKEKMWRYFTNNATHKWVDVLQKLVTAYNKSHHRSIDMAPTAVDKQNEIPLWVKQEQGSAKLPKKVNVKVGDYVRLSKAPKAFDRGFLPRWTEEVFQVTSVRVHRDPIQITVKDLNGDAVAGSFYKEEVQVVTKPEEYRVEYVVRERNRGGKKEYFVKWLGYPTSFNSWVGEDAVKRLDNTNQQ
jgi:hypothetical protein